MNAPSSISAGVVCAPFAQRHAPCSDGPLPNGVECAAPFFTAPSVNRRVCHRAPRRQPPILHLSYAMRVLKWPGSVRIVCAFGLSIAPMAFGTAFIFPSTQVCARCSAPPVPGVSQMWDPCSCPICFSCSGTTNRLLTSSAQSSAKLSLIKCSACARRQVSPALPPSGARPTQRVLRLPTC